MSYVTVLRNIAEIESFKKNKKAIIFYTSEECPACVDIKPFYDRVAARYHEKISFSIVDTRECRLNFDVHPIYEGYYEGKGIYQMEGVSIETLKDFVKAVINHGKGPRTENKSTTTTKNKNTNAGRNENTNRNKNTSTTRNKK